MTTQAYMLWNFALVTWALVAFALILYWLGPVVIARGIERWMSQDRYNEPTRKADPLSPEGKPSFDGLGTFWRLV